MKVLIVVGVIVGAIFVYGFVSMVSSVASENDRMESQINAIAGGTYK